MDEADAIKGALRKALPHGVKGASNRSRELQMWKDHKLWPPPELEQSIHRQPPYDGSASSENIEDKTDADYHRETPIDGGEQVTVPDTGRHREASLTDDEILKRAKKILMQDVYVAERPVTAKGKPSTLPTTQIAGRFPNELIEELRSLGGRMSNHLEKALRLYLKIIKMG
jgi:hypothetical protein